MASEVSLPPLDKYNLIGIWIATILYGENHIRRTRSTLTKVTAKESSMKINPSVANDSLMGSHSILLYASCVYVLLRKQKSHSKWFCPFLAA